MQRNPVLVSKITHDDGYKKNLKENQKSLEELQKLQAQARLGGGAKYIERHRSRGRLLPRERIELLLDRDSYFLEVGAIAGNGMRGESTGTAVVGGVGLVNSVPCLISASESTVKGGAITPTTLAKTKRLAEISEQNELVSIGLIESAGADLPNQDKIFVPGGSGFRDLTRKSAAGIPTICLVFGSSTAGGAYLPGMSDYAVMVKDQAQVYLAGPPLVKMATGEVTDHESLGGALMHASKSGVSDYLAEDERDAIRIGREIVAGLHRPTTATPYDVEEPLFDAEELLGIASHDLKAPFDPREVIARIADGSRFAEFKQLYGPTLVTGRAHIHGMPVGILANHGTLFSEAANKGAQFIQLCDRAGIPLLFLQNTTGFMVGQQYEQEGIIKNGAKLINAVSNCNVPAVTIMTGASYGAGNYAMCGRSYGPRFLFTWPNHRIAVMGGKQLAGVLEIIQRQSAAKKGIPVDEEKLAVMKGMTEIGIESQSTPFYASARLWDDGVIDPRDTRTIVAISLNVAQQGSPKGPARFGVFRH